jgi:Ca2+-binding RTX toxin-like protein
MVTVFNGTAGNDTFYAGDYGADVVVYGRGGADRLDAMWLWHATLRGGAGNDVLLAGYGGEAHLFGGRGDDVLDATRNVTGQTMMTGGHGADHF